MAVMSVAEISPRYLPMRSLSMVRTWWQSATEFGPTDDTPTTTGGNTLAEVDRGTTPTWRNLAFRGVIEKIRQGRAYRP